MTDIEQRREYDEWIRRRHEYKPECQHCGDSGFIPVDILFTALGVRKCPFCQQPALPATNITNSHEPPNTPETLRPL